MSRSKSVTKDIVAGGEMFVSIMAKLLELARANGATDEDIRRLSRPEGSYVLRLMAENIAQGISDPMRATVDYHSSLKSLLARIRSGEFFRSHELGLEVESLSECTADLLGLNLDLDFYLVGRNRQETATSIDGHLTKNGLRSATLRETLCWARTHPARVKGHVVILGDFEYGLQKGLNVPVCHINDDELYDMYDNGTLVYPSTAQYIAVSRDRSSAA